MSDDKFIRDIEERLTDGETIDDVTILPSPSGRRCALILKRDEGGNPIGRASILGCEICILPSMIEHLPGGMMRMSGINSLPVSALTEDDSVNPAMSVMRLCPECMRPIVHRDYVSMIGFEVVKDAGDS